MADDYSFPKGDLMAGKKGLVMGVANVNLCHIKHIMTGGKVRRYLRMLLYSLVRGVGFSSTSCGGLLKFGSSFLHDPSCQKCICVLAESPRQGKDQALRRENTAPNLFASLTQPLVRYLCSKDAIKTHFYGMMQPQRDHHAQQWMTLWQVHRGSVRQHRCWLRFRRGMSHMVAHSTKHC